MYARDLEASAMEQFDTHNRLHVQQDDRLLQHHLVEWPNEESFKETKTSESIKSQFDLSPWKLPLVFNWILEF